MKNCPNDVLIYLQFISGRNVTLENCEIYFIDKTIPYADNNEETESFDKSTLRENKELGAEQKRPAKYYKLFASSLTIKEDSINQNNLTNGLMILSSK